MKKIVLIGACWLLGMHTTVWAQSVNRKKFNQHWQFFLGETAPDAGSQWRNLSLPHDWSIELPFDSTSPTGTGGGALRGGMGWYKKIFTLPAADKDKNIFIDFDGVYRNSEVFINGQSLGVRPNGYISFRYDITPYVKFGNQQNILTVKVDNSQQPNSRWYSGSGIYRNVWLVTTGKAYVANWGTYITTPQVSAQKAIVKVATTISGDNGLCDVVTSIVNQQGKTVASQVQKNVLAANNSITQQFSIAVPILWSLENPYLYNVVTKIVRNGKTSDVYTTPLGIRSFLFDADKGFILNGKPVKIAGVCNHHDLGCLGTAINYRALERQLQILKGMGINGIRTSHNPPAPELLELCDKMGFVVMDEAFDMWRKSKNKFDYSVDFDGWYKQDLTDQVMRDRNHPSIFMWSIGNEIMEQWAPESEADAVKNIVSSMQQIVKSLDDRPTVTANNEPNAYNRILQSGLTDIIGYNYNHTKWPSDSLYKTWGRKPFIVTESVSALQTRGHYDMPSDSMHIWPKRWDVPLENANPDFTCSAYENCATPWGGTHMQNIQMLLKSKHISGMYVWTGFDYIGEPTPYPWPARSSYFGIVDLAGFPKDAYYLYQSVFTSKAMLHLFPHWNWQPGQTIDMWAYYNQADEVELFINGKSKGIKRKTGDALHVMWRVAFEPGTVKAVSRKNGKVVLTKELKTAGVPAKIELLADRLKINATADDMSFVTVKITDKNGVVVPDAANLVQFNVSGQGTLAGVDNGLQTDLSSFKASSKKAFNGLALAVIQSNGQQGAIVVKASAAGLQDAIITINAQ
jgi:beta-galactosidase